MDRLKLAPADLRITRCLNEDARSSIAKIAHRLRMPESTVRHRLGRLVKGGVIEFAVLTNPLHLGYQIWIVIEIQTELPRVRSVARRLAEAPEVYFVGLTTGSYDVFAAAVFRSNNDLLDFITHRLSKIPGIIRTSTSSILEMVKRARTFAIPEELVGSDRKARKPRSHMRKNPGNSGPRGS